MTEAHTIAQLPQEVKTAQRLIWIQSTVGIVAITLRIGLIVTETYPSWQSLLPPLGLLTLILPLLLGVLAASFLSRKKWTQTTTFITEGVAVFLVLLFGLRDLSTLVSLILGIVAVFWLTRPAALFWFNR